MNLITIVDTETTGTNPDQDRCIEVACALYSLELMSPVMYYSNVIETDRNEMEEINRIPAALLQIHGAPTASVWKYVSYVVGRGEAVIAHQASFDRGFFPEDLRSTKPWIDTMEDMEWPEKSSKSLVARALAHGVGVSHAHRALADVDTLVRLFQAVQRNYPKWDIQDALQNALKPRALFKAIVSYDDKDKAKTAGFAWNAPQKRWEKRLIVGHDYKFDFQTQLV